MTTQPAGPRDEASAAGRMLFTPGPRLGWIFRDRRRLASPYPEPEPDPQAAAGQVAARRERAERAWRFSLLWVARPLLPLAVVAYAAGALAREATRRVHPATLAWLPFALAAAGLAWPAWCLARLTLARRADPARAHHAAVDRWQQRAAVHHQAELVRLGQVPEWASATPPTRRTDIYGGTLNGWQSLLTVHGASILAERPLLVADFSGQLASSPLTGLARSHGIHGVVYPLPAALAASGIMTGMAASQLADAVAEAIHAGTPGGTARTDRAVDARAVMRLCTALDGNLTLGRLAAAAQAALGQPDPDAQLTPEEWDLISGDLLGETYRTQIGPSLVRLDAFLSGLARHAGTGPQQPPRPAWYTCLALEPGARSAGAELMTALTVQWLTVRVTQSAATAPAVIIAGADEITRTHLETLAGACERRGVPLTLLFRHLRDDATALIGGAAATAFMRLGNHHEAEQAAAFIGRHHKFTVSGWTATRGGQHSATSTSGYSHGTSHSRATTATTGWTGTGPWSRTPSGGRARTRDHGHNQQWSQSDTATDGTNWSSARSIQRVYEYAVEPATLQNLPEAALLLPVRGTPGNNLLAVECDPQIITLPGAAASLTAADHPAAVSPVGAPDGWPELDAPPGQSPWPSPQAPADSTPAWPPQEPDPRWPRPRD